MWTPRQMALLAIGFVGYLAGYLAYGRSFLGVIDGLPALPEEYQHVAGSEPPPQLPTSRPKSVEEKLKQAFGFECPELHWRIKLELHSRGMVLASHKSEIREGRVYLTPVSVAMFGKDKGKGKYPEINTIRGQEAYLKFDRPVASLMEINGRKVMEAELHGRADGTEAGNNGIEIVNNRGTPDRTDDIALYIGAGPLWFSDVKHLIWTEDTIHLRDMQCKPDPIQIWGKGMDLHLLTDSPPPTRGSAHGAFGTGPETEARVDLRSGEDRSPVQCRDVPVRRRQFGLSCRRSRESPKERTSRATATLVAKRLRGRGRGKSADPHHHAGPIYL